MFNKNDILWRLRTKKWHTYLVSVWKVRIMIGLKITWKITFKHSEDFSFCFVLLFYESNPHKQFKYIFRTKYEADLTW